MKLTINLFSWFIRFLIIVFGAFFIFIFAAIVSIVIALHFRDINLTPVLKMKSLSEFIRYSGYDIFVDSIIAKKNTILNTSINIDLNGLKVHDINSKKAIFTANNSSFSFPIHHLISGNFIPSIHSINNGGITFLPKNSKTIEYSSKSMHDLSLLYVSTFLNYYSKSEPLLKTTGVKFSNISFDIFSNNTIYKILVKESESKILRGDKIAKDTISIFEADLKDENLSSDFLMHHSSIIYNSEAFDVFTLCSIVSNIPKKCHLKVKNAPLNFYNFNLSNGTKFLSGKFDLDIDADLGIFSGIHELSIKFKASQDAIISSSDNIVIPLSLFNIDILGHENLTFIPFINGDIKVGNNASIKIAAKDVRIGKNNSPFDGSLNMSMKDILLNDALLSFCNKNILDSISSYKIESISGNISGDVSLYFDKSDLGKNWLSFNNKSKVSLKVLKPSFYFSSNNIEVSSEESNINLKNNKLVFDFANLVVDDDNIGKINFTLPINKQLISFNFENFNVKFAVLKKILKNIQINAINDSDIDLIFEGSLSLPFIYSPKDMASDLNISIKDKDSLYNLKISKKSGNQDFTAYLDFLESRVGNDLFGIYKEATDNLNGTVSFNLLKDRAININGRWFLNDNVVFQNVFDLYFDDKYKLRSGNFYLESDHLTSSLNYKEGEIDDIHLLLNAKSLAITQKFIEFLKLILSASNGGDSYISTSVNVDGITLPKDYHLNNLKCRMDLFNFLPISGSCGFEANALSNIIEFDGDEFKIEGRDISPIFNAFSGSRFSNFSFNGTGTVNREKRLMHSRINVGMEYLENNGGFVRPKSAIFDVVGKNGSKLYISDGTIDADAVSIKFGGMMDLLENYASFTGNAYVVNSAVKLIADDNVNLVCKSEGEVLSVIKNITVNGKKLSDIKDQSIIDTIRMLR